MKSSRRDVPQDQSYKSSILRPLFSGCDSVRNTQSHLVLACDRVCTEPVTAGICELSSSTGRINANLLSSWSHLPWFDSAPHSLKRGSDGGSYSPHNQSCSPHPGSGFPTQDSQPCCWNPMPDFTTPMNPLLPSTRFHVPSLLAFAVTPNLQIAPTVPPQQEAWPCSRSEASSSERVQPGHAHQQTGSGLWKSSHYRNGKSSAIAVPGQLSSTVMLSGFICQEFFYLSRITQLIK